MLDIHGTERHLFCMSLTNTNLRRIVYTSVLADASQAAVDAIHRTAASQNIHHGVTGALLVGQGHVVQLIEGEDHAVERLWTNLQEDLRHFRIVCLQDDPRAKARWFGGWAMYPASREEIFAVVNEALRYAQEHDQPHFVQSGLAALDRLNSATAAAAAERQHDTRAPSAPTPSSLGDNRASNPAS